MNVNQNLTDDEKFKTYQDKMKSNMIKDIPNRIGLIQEFNYLIESINRKLNEVNNKKLIDLEADYVIDTNQNWYLINIIGYTS